jgi:hypothetical protein
MRQFCEAIPADHPYRLLIHDRDAIFSKKVDQRVRNLGLRVIQTPVRTPVVNAVCERVIGTLRREYLDFVIALNQRHLYGILKERVAHYSEGRSHMSLGPGILSQPPVSMLITHRQYRHQLPPETSIPHCGLETQKKSRVTADKQNRSRNLLPPSPCGRPPSTGQIVGTARRHQPRPPVAGPGQAPGCLRPAGAGVWVVYRGVRHGGCIRRQKPYWKSWHKGFFSP